jgi:hypothetical protein
MQIFLAPPCLLAPRGTYFMQRAALSVRMIAITAHILTVLWELSATGMARELH